MPKKPENRKHQKPKSPNAVELEKRKLQQQIKQLEKRLNTKQIETRLLKSQKTQASKSQRLQFKQDFEKLKATVKKLGLENNPEYSDKKLIEILINEKRKISTYKKDFEETRKIISDLIQREKDIPRKKVLIRLELQLIQHKIIPKDLQLFLNHFYKK